MKRRFNPAAAQLALLAILGGILTVCSFLVLAPHYPHGSPQNLAQFAISLVLLAAGLPLWLKSLNGLKDGIQNNRWPQEQIEPLRAILESLPLQTLTWASLLLLCTQMYAMLVLGWHWETIWPAIILADTLRHLRQAVKRPPPSHPSIGWRNFPPIRSSHWGER